MNGASCIKPEIRGAVRTIAKCQTIEKSQVITKTGFGSDDNARQIQSPQIRYPGNATRAAIGDTKKERSRAAQKIPAIESNPAISLGVDK